MSQGKMNFFKKFLILGIDKVKIVCYNEFRKNKNVLIFGKIQKYIKKQLQKVKWNKKENRGGNKEKVGI